MCGIFSIFCRSSFIKNFIMKKHFLEPWNHGNLNISRPIYLKKISHTVLKIISAQISWKNSFVENVSFNDLQLFSRLQNHWFGPHFFPQKINFILFFKCDYLILMHYQKHALRISSEKTVKNWWFYSFK